MLWIYQSDSHLGSGKLEFIWEVKSWKLGKTAWLFMKFQSVITTHPILLLPADLLKTKILTVLHGILFPGSKSINLFIVRIYFRVSFIYRPQILLHEFVGEKLCSQIDRKHCIFPRQLVLILCFFYLKWCKMTVFTLPMHF